MKRSTPFFISASIAAWCAVGCVHTGPIEVVLDEKQLPAPNVLQTEYVSLPFATNIEGLAYNQGRLLLYNLRTDSIFTLLDTQRFGLLRSWGKIGRGPGEYSDFVQMAATQGGDLVLYDPSSARFDRVDPLEEGCITSRFSEGGRIELPRCMAVESATKPSRMVFSSFDARQTQIVAWTEGQEPYSIYRFPDLDQLASTAKNGFMCVNFEKNRVVYAYVRLRRFDIIDTSGAVVRRVSIAPSRNIEPPGEPTTLDTYTHYFGAWAGSDTFFLYYVGYTGRMLNENLRRPTYIEEYDYQGNPVARYELDQFVRKICSVGHKRFVGTTVDNERYSLVVLKE